MKSKQTSLTILFCLLALSIFGQQNPQKTEAILLTDICVNHICFGDSISKMLNEFGNADTMMFKPNRGSEFEEPTHREYCYKGLRFYEILYPNLSEGLFYGGRIERKNTILSIKGGNLQIGKTTVDFVLSHFESFVRKKGETKDKEYYIFFNVILPLTLQDVNGAFISEFHLYFTNGILTQGATVFDLN